MGNGQPPDAPDHDAEDWADLLDEAADDLPTGPRPLAVSAMRAPEPFAQEEDETATMPLDRARLGVPRLVPVPERPPAHPPVYSVSSIPPPVPREALAAWSRTHPGGRPGAGPASNPNKRTMALPLPTLGTPGAVPGALPGTGVGAGSVPPPRPASVPPTGFPTASTPLGGMRPTPTPLPPRPSLPGVPSYPSHPSHPSQAAPSEGPSGVVPRARRSATAIYGATAQYPEGAAVGPSSASLSSLPPPPDDTGQQQTLLGRLPVRPSAPPHSAHYGAWPDDAHEELNFPATPMPAWAHGSTTELVADDNVVQAIAGWSEPPPPPAGPADGFVSFGDGDELQFDPQQPAAPVRRPATLTPVPTGDSAAPPRFADAPSSDWGWEPPASVPPSARAAPPSAAPTHSVWSEPPAPSLPSLPPLDEEASFPPPPAGAVPSSRPPRARKPTPAMPMATLAALLGESGRPPEDDAVRSASTRAPPMSLAPRVPSMRADSGRFDLATPVPAGAASVPPAPKPVSESPGWSWDTPSTPAPVIDEKAEARAAMRDRLTQEDFAGALAVAERLVQLDRNDREARQVALRCREELREHYSRRLGPLDQVPSTVVTPSEIRWLSLDNRAGFVLSLIDGSSTIEDIVDVSSMPSLEVLRTLHNLLTQKVIVLRRARPRR